MIQGFEAGGFNTRHVVDKIKEKILNHEYFIVSSALFFGLIALIALVDAAAFQSILQLVQYVYVTIMIILAMNEIKAKASGKVENGEEAAEGIFSSATK